MRRAACCAVAGHPVVSLLASELIALMRQADEECTDSLTSMTIELLADGYRLALIDRSSQLSKPGFQPARLRSVRGLLAQSMRCITGIRLVVPKLRAMSGF